MVHSKGTASSTVASRPIRGRLDLAVVAVDFDWVFFFIELGRAFLLCPARMPVPLITKNFTAETPRAQRKTKPCVAPTALRNLHREGSRLLSEREAAAMARGSSRWREISEMVMPSWLQRRRFRL